MSVGEIDVAAAMRGLKDFQRRTVDYVFRRLYLDATPATRFLIADEVGLGKTLVARGIIAKTVQHLQNRGAKRIDVLYVCSNASIAQQNLNKLNITDQPTSTFATRLTLLPMQLRDFKDNGINFLSFTPGTTFDLKGRGGRIDERALIYQMLIDRTRLPQRQLLRLLQCTASARGWHRQAKRYELDYDGALADRYANALKADGPFMDRLQSVCARFHRVKRVSRELNNDRLHIVGDLRRRLADECIDALEPDLVILDEFQRFKDLLHAEENDNAAELAQRLFRYETEHGNVRILLLSATPYRMLSMAHEGKDEDHYADFLRTLDFLLDGDKVRLQEITDELRRFRESLYGLDANAGEQAAASRDRLQEHLRSVIARTERIDMTRGGNAMITERQQKVQLIAEDLLAARFAARVAGCVDAGDTVEYWKSSPYLVNFMDQYELKQKLLAGCRGASPELLNTFRKADGQLLRNLNVQRYQPLAANNPRLRSLLDDTLNPGQWQWLWLPPSLPYITPRGPYGLQNVHATKALIFSNWQVVPDVIAAVGSYEAERLMLNGTKDLPAYRLLHKKRRQLLQFRLDAEKKSPAGMPALALVYPCATLAALADPLALSVALGGGASVNVDLLRDAARERIEAKLTSLPPGDLDSARIDERWYWAAPVLLDRHFAEEVLDWIENDDDGFLAAAAGDEEVGAALRQHVDLLRQVSAGSIELGRQPADLAEVLAEMALGSPGICAIRAMQRVASDLPETSQIMLSSATAIASGLRSLFNQPEVTAMLRSGEVADDDRIEDGQLPYWRRVLHYCIEGNLQAVLDEFAHVLKESEGLAHRPGDEIARGVGSAIAEALSLRPSTLRADDFKPTRAGHVRVKQFSIRCRFALRFGDVRDDDGKTLVRSGSVRRAFNSPFRPFILASTSVGQEGLDFHPYCHAVYHWNLPSNPVDLEQREGRVHRYKGHAIRRNVAKKYGLESLCKAVESDPWHTMFERAARDRDPGTSELIPYWMFEIEGGFAVERHVPLLPLSREVAQFRRLKRMLAIYRLAFGQPRQEELLCYLTDGATSEISTSNSELRLQLTPPA